MILEILKLIASPVTGLIKDHMKEKARKQEQKERIEEAKVMHKINRIEKGDNHAMEMDITERKNAGYMDDFSFFVFMIPAILAFFPEYVDDVQAGFAVLESMPDWYKYALGGMLIAIWGYRRLLMPIIERIIKNKLK